MLIDIVSSAATAAVPTEEPTAASTEAPSDGPGSFAALLGNAAKESDDSTPVDADEEEDDVDVHPWTTVPVVVPFLGPIVPQEIPAPEAKVDVVPFAPVSDDGLPIQVAVDATPWIDPNATAATPDVRPFDVTSAQGEVAKAVTPEATSRTDASDAPPETATTTPPAVVDAMPWIDPGAAAETPEVKAATELVTSETSVQKDSAPSGAPARAEKGSRSPAHAHKVSHDAAAQERPAGATPATGAPATGAPATDAVASAAPRPEERVTEMPSRESEAGAKGLAARLARALERATENVAMSGSDAATANTSQDSSSGENGQPSFGQWLKEQLLPQTPAAHQAGSAAPAFAVTAPQIDARINALLAAAGSPLVGSAPVLPSEHDVAAQLVQSLKLQFRDGIGEAVLRLKPEHLGSVSISIRVENGGIKANVQAEVAAVRQWLESQQDTLRNGLAEHGLRLDRFDVDPEGERHMPSSDAREEQSARRRQRQQRRSVQDDQPVFEVVV